MTCETKLKEIRERIAKATPGPYQIHTGFDRTVTTRSAYGAYLEIGEKSLLVSQLSDSDRQVLAHSRADIEMLVKMVEVARKSLQYCALPPYRLHPANNAQYVNAMNCIAELDLLASGIIPNSV